jgi:K+-sensing histidine kinase KdpD
MDFKEHDIYVEFCEYKGNALFDYSTFRCSLFHIFDNATKYAMPSTTVKIDIVEDAGFIKVRFIMRSLPILLEEIDAICSDGVSGRMPTAYGLQGHGHGLFITKDLLAMNNAVCKILPNYTNKGRYRHTNGREYEDNLFEIQMQK